MKLMLCGLASVTLLLLLMNCLPTEAKPSYEEQELRSILRAIIGQKLENDLKCPSDEFKCHSGDKCISSSSYCDQKADCADGSDENCTCTYEHVPHLTFFQCFNGECVLSRFVCDDEDDCGDGSDENYCTAPCRAFQFQCQNNNNCIAKEYECDGDNDCGDYSDETNCSHVTCAPGQFRCLHNARCIDQDKVCDAINNCWDWSDEEDCPRKPCPGDKFNCSRYGTSCIPKSWVCDGAADCGDGSDEKNCDH